MLQLIRLILKNVVRNRLRTFLTATAVIVLAAVFVVEQAVTSKVRTMIQQQSGQTKLLVSERWVIPSWIPVRNIAEIVEIPGVNDWAAWRLYTGYLDEAGQQDRLAMGIATQTDNLIEMTQDLAELDPALVDALSRERTGALVGSGLMDTLGWKVGQQFTCISVSHPGKDLRFKVVGALPPGVWATTFFFREDYYEDGTGNDSTVNFIWLKVRNAETGQKVSSRIRELFDRREPSVKVETESAGVARFAGRSELLFAIINAVSAVLIADMVIILANSISLTTRERRGEIALLKVLGFSRGQIMMLVVGEATMVGAVSGALGACLAWMFFYLGSQGWLPDAVSSIAEIFTIPLQTMLRGVGVGILVGAAASALPAWNARNVRIVDVFAKIA
jgi:putative ABC transport system permease protein